MEMSEQMIEAKKVPDNERMSFLPRVFGPDALSMVQNEARVYQWMEHLSPDYRGGYWEFYDLSNGGFFLAPAGDKRYRVQVKGNYFDGEMSAQAAGIVATLFTLGQVAAQTEDEHYIDAYHDLLEYASEHPERELILAAID